MSRPNEQAARDVDSPQRRLALFDLGLLMSWTDRPSELFQLDAETCRTLLAIHQVGRLVLPGSDPYIIPVNYVFEDDHVLLPTERRAVIEAALGRRVAFEVDMIDPRTRSGWSVVVRGVASEVADQDAAADPDVHSWAPGDRRSLIRIHAEELTGRLLRGAVAADTGDPAGYL